MVDIPGFSERQIEIFSKSKKFNEAVGKLEALQAQINALNYHIAANNTTNLEYGKAIGRHKESMTICQQDITKITYEMGEISCRTCNRPVVVNPMATRYQPDTHNMLSLALKPEHWSLQTRTRHHAEDDRGRDKDIWIPTAKWDGKEGRSLCNALQRLGKDRDDWFLMGLNLKIYTTDLARLTHEHPINHPDKARKRLTLTMDFSSTEPTWVLDEQGPLMPHDEAYRVQWWTQDLPCNKPDTNWRNLLPRVQDYMFNMCIKSITEELAIKLVIHQPPLSLPQKGE